MLCRSLAGDAALVTMVCALVGAATVASLVAPLRAADPVPRVASIGAAAAASLAWEANSAERAIVAIAPWDARLPLILRLGWCTLGVFLLAYLRFGACVLRMCDWR